MNNELKNCMFQYATKHKTKEDTDLITREEANALWDKWQNDIRENWDELDSPQMCIWVECEKNTDYSKIAKEIDYRDCELENGSFYKITKEKIT